MNERPSHEINSNQREIGDAEKEIFIDKVRRAAPFERQPVNQFGVYRTNYDAGDTSISLYIPSVIEGITEDEFMTNDSLSVVIHDEKGIDERYTLVTTRHYVVHLSDMSADYDETIRRYDIEHNKWADPLYASTSMDDLRDFYNTQQALGATIFTKERFDDVCKVLDQLDPVDRW